ncbi:MAG: hypothetical protein HY322_18300 [Betaproteobacteria bacterium]|nr:hypothetical protein [Betaproteobacteria bacterium]
MRAALLDAIRARPVLWAVYALGFVAAYHALLLVAMVLRFGHAPNFIKVYDIVDAYRLTFTGTPSLRDAFGIAIGEPWLDVGYMSPQWNMAEWSLMILPPQFVLICVTGCLLATFGVLHAARSAQCSRAPTGSALTAAIGAGLAGMANATLFWVVCCATPTWIVGLAMLGVSVSVAFMLQPIGPLLTAGGVALLVWAIVIQLRSIAPLPAAPQFFTLPVQRSA